MGRLPGSARCCTGWRWPRQMQASCVAEYAGPVPMTHVANCAAGQVQGSLGMAAAGCSPVSMAGPVHAAAGTEMATVVRTRGGLRGSRAPNT